MKQLDTIKRLINEGDISQAIIMLEHILQDDSCNTNKDEIFYLLGNAHRKLGDWQQALNHYQKAIDLNPDHPALHARKAVLDILEFYHKDMFNQ